MDDKLKLQWEKRWSDDEKHNLTFIGKRMLGAKQRALKKILTEIKPKNAVDVGCALGYTLSTFKEVGVDAIGIDISPAAVEICQKKGLKAKLQNLETIEEKYDFVFSDGLLEHFLNFEPIAKHLMRISNRYVCLTQTDHGSFTGKTSIYLAELLRGKKNVLEYNYRIEDFISVFAKHGFSLRKKQKIFLNIFQLLLFEKH